MIQVEPHRITGHRTVNDPILIGGIGSGGATQYPTVLIEDEQVWSIGICNIRARRCGPFPGKVRRHSD
jgi:hypothetical protein